MRFALIVSFGFLVACSEAAPASSPTPAAAEVPVVAPAAPAAPVVAAPPPTTVASCTTPFGYCTEWAGTQWVALGADDAARETRARATCRTTFALGEPCARDGLVGTCALEHHVTYNYGTVSTAASSCRSQRGVWTAE